MRKILYLFIYIAAFAVLCACGGKKGQNSNTIYVSIAPLKPIVEGIVGDDYAIEVLVPAGASPETFEPTAKQFIALNEAKIIFGTGLLDFEKSLLARIHDQSKVVNLSNGIETIAGSCSHTHHGRHCHHGVDPHIWCSPKSTPDRPTSRKVEAVRGLTGKPTVIWPRIAARPTSAATMPKPSAV